MLSINNLGGPNISYHVLVRGGPHDDRHGDPRGDPLDHDLYPNHRNVRIPRSVLLPICDGVRIGQCLQIPIHRDGRTRCGGHTRGDVCLHLVSE